MKRGVSIILLCEDSLHDCFVRYVLEDLNLRGRDFSRNIAPAGVGSAEQWVREQFPAQLRALRSRGGKTALIVVTDADRLTVQERRGSVLKQLDVLGFPLPSANEGVFWVTPKWEIETWLKYLNGEPFSETEKGDRKDFLRRERNCRPLAQKLSEMCRAQQLTPEPPPSLTEACTEYARLKQYLS